MGPDGEGQIEINVGTDFCVSRDDNLRIILFCTLGTRPTPIPLPTLAWSKDGDEIYSLLTNVQPAINNSFFTVEGNEILGPLEINPRVLTVTPDGFIQLVTQAFNISDTATSNIDTTVPLRGLVVDAVIGDYECEASNVYGSERAVTTIRTCGELFFGHTYTFVWSWCVCCCFLVALLLVFLPFFIHWLIYQMLILTTTSL